MSKFMESDLSAVRISDSNLISVTPVMVFYCGLMLKTRSAILTDAGGSHF